MRNLAISLKRSGFALGATVFTAVLATANLGLFNVSADAAQFVDRKLELSSTLAGDIVGDSQGAYNDGQDATHTFTFTVGTDASTVSAKSWSFEYCDDSIGTCTAPGGVDVDTGSSIATQTINAGAFGNSYAVVGGSSTNNKLCLGNASGNNTAAGDDIIFAIDDVKNPTDVAPFFVHIVSYTSADCTTGSSDDGTVASAITEGIEITAKVKETLGFSVTGSKTDGAGGVTAPGATCAPLEGSGAINLGDTTDHTLAFDTTYTNHSYFRIYTNALGGASVQYGGDTLKKTPTVAIAALSSETDLTSAQGSEHFGLGIDTTNTTDNSETFTAPTNVTSAANFGNAGYLTLASGYDEAGSNKYNFATASTTNPVEIASSTGYLLCNTVPVRYAADISPNTPAGVYRSTIVYYAVPTY
jgi:hypothetical protein